MPARQGTGEFPNDLCFGIITHAIFYLIELAKKLPDYVYQTQDISDGFLQFWLQFFVKSHLYFFRIYGSMYL